MGLCFHAFFFININALIVYFTEKLDPWEFSDELLSLLLGAVLMSVMFIFRDCTIWAPGNGGVTQCFLRGNTQVAKIFLKPTGNAP